jgi:transposase
MTAMTRPAIGSVREATLYVAFELGAKHWKLALTSGFDVKPIVRTVSAGDLSAVTRVLADAAARLGLGRHPRVVSCYEAGRDGFWVHRALVALGVANRVVDSASIEVNRRARRAKTDRLDALKLVQMLVRVCRGEERVWREVHVPAVTLEAARYVSRERRQLQKERTRVINQLRSWLATWGCALPRQRTGAWWTTVRDWAGTCLPATVQARIARAEIRLALLTQQLEAVERVQHTAPTDATAAQARRRLLRLKGVATTSARVLLDEGLVWREFRNRRQVGGMLGFTPMPYHSGESAHDQGIDRAGNPRWRAVAIQLAWSWVRWQPGSALTQWYERRFARQGGRARRIGIVALARKLLIALWRYATTGAVPAGAVVKSA